MDRASPQQTSRPRARRAPAGDRRRAERVVHFEFDAPPHAQAVAIVGDFNGWDPSTHAMQREPQGGMWVADLRLPSGRHQYRFCINGDEWQSDPRAAVSEPNGFGGENSVIDVT